MSRLTRILDILNSINKGVGGAATFIIYPLMLIIAYEVVMRYVFNSPTSWAHDLSRQVFGIYIVLLGGFVMLHSKHVTMDLLWKRLPRRAAAALDLFSHLFGFVFLSLLLWRGTQVAIRAVLTMEQSANPSNITIYIFPLRILVVVGASLFALQLIIMYINNVRTVLGKQQ